MPSDRKCLSHPEPTCPQACCLLLSPREPMPTANHSRELGSVVAFFSPSSAFSSEQILTQPGLPEDERKAEAKKDHNQHQPERGWARDKRGVGPVTPPGA